MSAADLQHRCFAVAAGQRHHIGLGHGRDHDDFRQLFVAQHEPGFSANGEVMGVMVQDDVSLTVPFQTV
jgi:hypothetical protein